MGGSTGIIDLAPSSLYEGCSEAQLLQQSIMTRNGTYPEVCVHNSGIALFPLRLYAHWFRFARELALPALPEMVFPSNSLRLEHEAGCTLEFTALEALRRVDAQHDSLKVAVAEEWSRTQ